MSLYLALPEIAFLINGFVIVYIIVQKRRSKINRAFLIYSWNIAFWILCIIIIRGNPDNNSIITIFKLASVAWLSIGFLFLNFTYAYINKSRDWIYYTLGILLMIAVIVSSTTGYVIRGYTNYFWGAAAMYGEMFIPAVIVVILSPVTLALYMIFRNASRSESVLIKKQHLL